MWPVLALVPCVFHFFLPFKWIIIPKNAKVRPKDIFFMNRLVYWWRSMNERVILLYTGGLFAHSCDCVCMCVLVCLWCACVYVWKYYTIVNCIYIPIECVFSFFFHIHCSVQFCSYECIDLWCVLMCMRMRVCASIDWCVCIYFFFFSHRLGLFLKSLNWVCWIVQFRSFLFEHWTQRKKN